MTSGSGVRCAFLDTTGVSLDLLRRDEIARAWDGPSALRHWAVSGLAGHLVRGTTSVEAYLDRSTDVTEEPVTAAGYYAAAVDSADLDSELHQAIRRRGDDMAAGGHQALVEDLAQANARLQLRLESEPANRKLRAHKGIPLLLDDYLITRVVELTTHIDDLAVSARISTPPISAHATTLAIGCLIEVARLRAGDVAVLRALTRRERDTTDALRVL